MANPLRAVTVYPSVAKLSASPGPQQEEYATCLDLPRSYRWVAGDTTTIDDFNTVGHSGGNEGRWIAYDDLYDRGADLGDASTTIDVTGLTWRVIPQGTLSSDRVITLGVTGAHRGAELVITRLDSSINELRVENGGPLGGALTTFPSDLVGYAKFKFDGEDWSLREFAPTFVPDDAGISDNEIVISPGANRAAAITAAIASQASLYASDGTIRTVRLLTGDYGLEASITMLNGVYLARSPGTSFSGTGANSLPHFSVADADAEPDLVFNYHTAANAPGRSGSYVASLTTYTSTIDPSLTTLSTYICYDAGCAASAISSGRKLPVLVFGHGYNQDASYISDSVKHRAADAGFVAVAPHQRGRGGNPGTADDARDLQDIVDAIATAAATYPTVVDATRVHMIGFSGGGAATIAIQTKYPGLCISALSCFGWGDVGLDPRPDHSYWGSRDARAVVAGRVGTRTDLDRYRARSSNNNIADAIAQSNGLLWMVWDAQDPIGRALRDVRDALRAADSPTSRWAANETDVGSSPRWLHGYPDTNPDLIYAEQLVYKRQQMPAPTVLHAGKYNVAGFVVHAAGFEVWTAATGVTNCKLDSDGGRKHSVLVEFDVGTRQFLVSPKSGACAVTIIQGRRRLTRDVSAANTVFDLANLMEAIIPDASHIFDAARGVGTTGSNVNTWTEQVAGSNAVPGAATKPTYNNPDQTIYPGLQFITNGERLRLSKTLSTGTADWAFACRFRSTSGHGLQCPLSFTDAAGGVVQSVYFLVDDTTFRLGVESAGGSATATYSGYGPGNGYNFMFGQRSGSNLTLVVNQESPVTVSISSGNITATRINIGELDYSPAAGEFFGLYGAVGQIVAVSGRPWTAQERLDIYDLWYSIGDFR